MSVESEAPLLAIVGPTATGKTSIAVALAARLGAEIISVDSMAVYRGMDVGTAKPTVEERRQAAFHLVDVVDPLEPFNAHLFRELANEAIAGIRSRGKQPLLVGGTGLYLRAVVSGMGLTAAPADAEFRAEMEALALAHGPAHVHGLLATVDPVQAGRIHPNDLVRSVRALEVRRVTGLTMSEYQARDAAARSPRPCRCICIHTDRYTMDRRINERTERMMLGGLVDETRVLLERGVPQDAPAMRGLGYQECVQHLVGRITRDQATEEIQRNTRRFARRQLTWFRHEPEVHWVDVTGQALSIASERVLAALGTRSP